MTNPSAWSNPPPPGIDMDEESKHSTISTKSVSASLLDHIDPFIKNPEYIKYKKSLSHKRSRSRSRDRNRSRSRERRRRHRSRSRGRHRRSRSKSRGRHRRRYSRSSSRSRSPSHERRHKHKKRHSRRHSRSRSRSRSNRHKERKRSRRTRSHTHSPSDLNDSFEGGDRGEEDDVDDPSKENAFKNDGSFLEMFKKMQEEKEKEEAEKAGTSEPKKLLPAFGKRRGGRVLKTGMVEKIRSNEDDDVSNSQDPWSIYLKEVKKYKEACCDDDSKTRPLVK